MWILKASKNKPFWAIQNGNKPSKAIFDKYISTLEQIEGNINYTDYFTGEFVSKYNGYEYFSYFNDETNETRYFYKNGVKFIQKNNIYVYNLQLDIYATFTLPFLNDNMDKDFMFNRIHIYNPDVATIGDSELDVSVKPYSSINKQYYYYPHSFNNNNDNFYYNNTFGFANPENNAYKYFVFNDGPNGTYTILPCVNKTSKLKFYKPNRNIGNKIYEGVFTKGDKKYKNNKREYVSNISDDLNTQIINAYKTGKEVKYFYRTIKDNVNWVGLNNYQEIKVPFNTMPSDFNCSISYNTQSPGFDEINSYTTINGNQIYSSWCDGITAGNWDTGWSRAKEQLTFKVEIYDVSYSGLSTIDVYNNEIDCYLFANSSDWVNKFVGIFSGPNLLAFDFLDLSFTDTLGKKFITISLPANGIKINPFGIYRYNYKEVDGINNPLNGSPYVLRYQNVNYFGNDINIQARYNPSCLISVSGNLVFSNGFYLVDKSSDLLSIYQSVIYYGGMLPTSKNLYKEYVNSQRTMLDTNYSVKRQEAMISNLSGGISNGLNWVTGSAQIGADILQGNIGGAVKTGFNLYKDTGSMIGGIFNTERQLKNYRREQLGAFAQANINIGNQINLSSINDASIQKYLETNGEQVEVVEVKRLNEWANIFVNNYTFMYGFYFPHTTTLTEFLDTSRRFNYVEIQETTFLNNINLTVNLDSMYLELVKEQLINGIRIWNQETLTIPDALKEDLPALNESYVNIPQIPPNNNIPALPDSPPELVIENIEISETNLKSIKINAENIVLSPGSVVKYNKPNWDVLNINISKQTGDNGIMIYDSIYDEKNNFNINITSQDHITYVIKPRKDIMFNDRTTIINGNEVYNIFDGKNGDVVLDITTLNSNNMYLGDVFLTNFPLSGLYNNVYYSYDKDREINNLTITLKNTNKLLLKSFHNPSPQITINVKYYGNKPTIDNRLPRGYIVNYEKIG